MVEFFVSQLGDRGVGVYSEAVEGDVFDAKAGEAFCGEEALDDHAKAFFGFFFYDQSNGPGLPCDLYFFDRTVTQGKKSFACLVTQPAPAFVNQPLKFVVHLRINDLNLRLDQRFRDQRGKVRHDLFDLWAAAGEAGYGWRAG